MMGIYDAPVLNYCTFGVFLNSYSTELRNVKHKSPRSG